MNVKDNDLRELGKSRRSSLLDLWISLDFTMKDIPESEAGLTALKRSSTNRAETGT